MNKKMDYKQTIDFLYAQLPIFQRQGAVAYKANLDNTIALDELLNHPHKLYKTIHVAGTNGKGSVSHTLASILQSQGYKVGLYTSPHLKDFRERIRVNGEMINEEYVVDFTQRTLPFIKSNAPSFFELTVGMAFNYFADKKVDIAVIEVGLGGRLDSTNIITPEVTVITNISFDHKNILGDTLTQIAKEKAGIIKPTIPIVIGRRNPETDAVFNDTSTTCNAPITYAQDCYKAERAMRTLNGKQNFNFYKGDELLYQNLECDLMGFYQNENLATVLTTVERIRERGIKINKESVYKGVSSVIKDTGLLGRWQTLGANPLIIADTGHNEDGIKQVIHQIENTPHKQLHFVIGMVNDKEIDSILKMLPKKAFYYFTQAQIPRSLSPTDLAKKGLIYGLKGKTYETVALAMEDAKKNASTNDLIFIGGSTFIVAEAI